MRVPDGTGSRHRPPAATDDNGGLGDLPLFAPAADPAGLPWPVVTIPAGPVGPVPVAGERPHPSTAHVAAAPPTPVEVDWHLVNLLRAKASDRLSTALSDPGRPLDAVAQRELGRTIVVDLLEEEARAALTSGRSPMTAAEQDRTARAVHDALFGLGRLQPLVDTADVENIEINGCDRVTLQYADGSRRAGPPVADTDAELLDFLAFLASRGQGNGRPFSPARPTLHLTLDGGSRLAATAWITPRPVVVVRRHRLRLVRLADLVDQGMMPPAAGSFLAAAVRDRRSVVVAGPQGAGKTTMVRALAEELPLWERIGTFETEYELFLHELPGRQGSVAAWEARPGSGERGPDGRQAGEITVDDCLYDSFRFNLDRQIVGEVRGREVLAMFKAMQSGAGSISTTHAASAVGAIRKLVTCALEAGPQVTVDYAQRVVAEHIDLVVQLDLDVRADPRTGQPIRRRRVSEIVAVHPGENGPAHTEVFRSVTGASPDERARLVPGTLPDDYRSLARQGFDLGGFTRQQEATGAGAPR